MHGKNIVGHGDTSKLKFVVQYNTVLTYFTFRGLLCRGNALFCCFSTVFGTAAAQVKGKCRSVAEVELDEKCMTRPRQIADLIT